MSKQAEREFARKVEQSQLYVKPFTLPRMFREFAIVLELLQQASPPGSRVLDMGCGPGWTSLFLARAGYRVVGVDIAERMIEVAQERGAQEAAGSDVEFLVGDMEDLDLGRYDFSSVLFFDCLHHCPKFEQALRQAHLHLQ